MECHGRHHQHCCHQPEHQHCGVCWVCCSTSCHHGWDFQPDLLLHVLLLPSALLLLPLSCLHSPHHHLPQ
jgi:hypothetical protein